MSAPNEAWQIVSPSTLQLNALSSSLPVPGRDQSLIRISFFALNFRDLLVIDHSPAYPLPTSPFLIPGSDACGIVYSSSKFNKGDKVVIVPNTWLKGSDVRDYTFDEVLGGGDVQGTFRRWMVVDDERLVSVPDNLEMKEAAGLFTAGVTAMNALFYGPRALEKDQWLLIQGTGGVSCAGIQLASAAGAIVVATSSSDEKLEVAKKLGATHTINYRNTPDWAAEVLRLTGGKGVDQVLEVGGAGTIEQSLRSARPGVLVTVVGILTESEKADLIPAILFGPKTVRGVLGAGSKEMFEKMLEMVAEHDIHPTVGKVFEFEEADQAVQLLRNFNGVGKLVVRA